jgi:hypothetical protein
METSGSTGVINTPAPKRFLPSIVAPLELSRRPDKHRKSHLLVRAGRVNAASLALTSALPSPDLVGIDRKRVDEAAAWIRAKIAATLRQGAEDVGEYVLDTFFSGDPELAKAKNPHKNVSYRALAEKCGTSELPVSKTWLNNAVGIAVILRRLSGSANAFRVLPPSFQEALLPLRDPGRVEKVAAQAAEKELSFRELRKFVSEERSRQPRFDHRGRPPIPPIIKTLNRSLTLLGIGRRKGGISRSEIRALNDRQKWTARHSAERLIRKLRGIVHELR